MSLAPSPMATVCTSGTLLVREPAKGRRLCPAVDHGPDHPAGEGAVDDLSSLASQKSMASSSAKGATI